MTKSKKHTKFAQKAFKEIAKEVKPITDLMAQRSTGSPFFDEILRAEPIIEKSPKKLKYSKRRSKF